MAKSSIKHSNDIEYLFELANQSWALSEDDIKSIQPGAGGIQQVKNLLDIPLPADRPLVPKTSFDVENPHIHILKVLRNPEFFPFACKVLFGKPDGSGPLMLLPFQQIVLQELWWRQFPILLMSRGSGKSFILALCALLRATFTPGAKIVITGAGFRQSKAVFDYMIRIWQNSPVFRSLVNSGRAGFKKDRTWRANGPYSGVDKVEFIIGDSVITGIPLGDGEKVRGMRANYIFADEMGSISESIYSVVIQGFASVTADPVGNVKDYAKMRVLKRLGLWNNQLDDEELRKVRGNQSVISGTGTYAFNHFYKYWKDYKNIIESCGDKTKLENIFNSPIPEGFKWNSYSIIRIAWEMIPHGFMDQETIIRAKRITNTSQFNMEYNSCFIRDSDGFFKRSLIEKCVIGKADEEEPVSFPSCGKVDFVAALRGDPKCKYVYGIDPASESDQFALVITELHPEHRRVVYCWTTMKDKQKQQLRNNKTGEHNFYRFCVSKIRSLFKDFPPERVLVDKGGGGIAIREAFGDPDGLKDGELPIYEMIDPEPRKHKYTDDLAGLHILEIVDFTLEWTSEANEGMKKDMEDRVLLFPNINSAVLGLAQVADEMSGRVSFNDEGEKVFTTEDTLEQVMFEIEKLKDELATIVVSSTKTGKSHWDTPDVKTPGSKVGRMRKDRYSALLMSNMGARQIARAVEGFIYNGCFGGFASDLVNPNIPRIKDNNISLYKGPLWWTNQVGSGHYGAVARKDE